MKRLFSWCAFLLLFFFAFPAQAVDLRVYTEEFPPFNFTQNKQITGVSTEVVTRILKDVGLSARIQSLPWKDTYSLAQKQKNTLIYSISRRREREKLFKWIGVITPTTYSVIALTSRKDIHISRLEDLKKYKIGTTEDDVVEKWLLSKGFALTDFVRTSGENPTLKEYKSLLNKRIDVWPAPDALAFHVVRQEGHSNPQAVIQKAFPLEELSDGYYMAASLQTPDEVVARLAQALTKFKQTDDYLKIMSHWGIEASGVESSAPIAKLIYSIKSLSPVAKVGYLAGDVIESHREGGYYRKQMREDFVEYYVDSFDQWLEKYAAMQKEVDLIILGSTEGIAGWNQQKALKSVMSQTSVPTGSMVADLAEYACIGFEGNGMVVNLKVAEQIGLKIPRSFMRRASRVIQ